MPLTVSFPSTTAPLPLRTRRTTLPLLAGNALPGIPAIIVPQGALACVQLIATDPISRPLAATTNRMPFILEDSRSMNSNDINGATMEG
jgi:hypothetical protein